MACRGFLQLILKLLNLLLIIVGVIMIVYSLWMLKEWHTHPKPPSVETASSMAVANMPFGSAPSLPNTQIEEKVPEMRLKRPLLLLTYKSSLEDHPFLPAPWFIYGFLGIGIFVTLIPFLGYIAAETSHGCCLSCYTFFLGIVLLLQAAIAATIFFDHHWEQDIPKDPTGEFEHLKDFVMENFKLCKWVGLGVVVVEALSLLFAMIFQAVVSGARRTGYDSDDDYVAPRSYRQPLLNRQPTQGANVTATSDSRPPRNDAWSTRLREKYGLNTAQFSYTASEPRMLLQQNGTPEEKKGCCSIM
ncbi:hypothetical protein O6H91_02G121200 [Diphasiastrum complanatum]|uniref:Uncharacterized protein n=1 Tax=Diphasiastrum complanatum TaxID=34168 RepID=A0ACC2EK35_DIPCM|nr:hypothetical protein O6H91_02G121200 [Diphasiastrum complanatum]